jgi:hypothetical protein
MSNNINRADWTLRNPWGIVHKVPSVEFRISNDPPLGFVYVNDTRMKFFPAVLCEKRGRGKNKNVKLSRTLVLTDANWGYPTKNERLACAEALQSEFPDYYIVIDLCIIPEWLSWDAPWDQAGTTPCESDLAQSSEPDQLVKTSGCLLDSSVH